MNRAGGQPMGQAAPPVYYPAPAPPAHAYCNTCGNGSRLAPELTVCPQCRWLRPLVANFRLDCSAFQWAQDGAAMAKLRSIGPLNRAAQAISDKAGRRWVETTFNGIRLSETQLPAVYAQAVRAARLLAMPYMPEVYVSGDRMWDAMTFGSDRSAFIVLGTALLTNFQGDDLLFVLAREMGHCRAGHALWKTVSRFLIGEQGPKRGLMANGLFAALNPAHLVEGAMELPLLAWARQAEITADRAGLIAVGDPAIARRVLLSWSLKSTMLYRQVNVEAWLQQMEDSDDSMTRLSEVISSSTPYITRRLKLIEEYGISPQLQYWHNVIRTFAGSLALTPDSGRAARRLNPASPAVRDIAPARQANPASAPDPEIETCAARKDLRISCASCKTALRIPRAALAGKDALNVRCPNPACSKVMTLKRQPSPPAPPSERTAARV
jgi:Zn-dependent protease with chaperone function